MPAASRPSDEDHGADFARREADIGHARARREAQALRLGARVADHERGSHGDRRQPSRRTRNFERRKPKAMPT